MKSLVFVVMSNKVSWS